jgi:hypothetical protein
MFQPILVIFRCLKFADDTISVHKFHFGDMSSSVCPCVLWHNRLRAPEYREISCPHQKSNPGRPVCSFRYTDLAITALYMLDLNPRLAPSPWLYMLTYNSDLIMSRPYKTEISKLNKERRIWCSHSDDYMRHFGGTRRLRNVGWLSTDYTVLHPRTQNCS